MTDSYEAERRARMAWDTLPYAQMSAAYRAGSAKAKRPQTSSRPVAANNATFSTPASKAKSIDIAAVKATAHSEGFAAATRRMSIVMSSSVGKAYPSEAITVLCSSASAGMSAATVIANLGGAVEALNAQKQQAINASWDKVTSKLNDRQSGGLCLATAMAARFQQKDTQ